MSFEPFYACDRKSISTTPSDARTKSGFFDCNICLDYVCDPVVTLCGHLYCWPCIYKWLHTQKSAYLSANKHPACPVCKAEISHTALVPLYGPNEPGHKRKTFHSMSIPPRPQGVGTQLLARTSQSHQQISYRNPYQNQHYENENDYSSSSLRYSLNRGTTTGFRHPVVVMFQKMFFRENMNGYSNSYNLMGNSNNFRLRREEMQAEKSLNRISIFLFCCFLLCLLLF